MIDAAKCNSRLGSETFEIIVQVRQKITLLQAQPHIVESGFNFLVCEKYGFVLGDNDFAAITCPRVNILEHKPMNSLQMLKLEVAYDGLFLELENTN